MNPQWFGDSFDIVKRYFVQILNDLNYQVAVDPMLTGEWNGQERNFYKFLNVVHAEDKQSGKTALLIDPDTGIGARRTPKHITIQCIVDRLRFFDIVFSFDQSFSRGSNVTEKIHEKLASLYGAGAHGFYYDSHARFLFASNSVEKLKAVENQLISSGLPHGRLIHG